MSTTLPRFITESLADFTERAKHVAWLLQTPLQRTQNFLARLYGYADMHEYRAAFERAQRQPGGFKPGPYLADQMRGYFNFDANPEPRSGEAPEIRIHNGVLQALQEFLQISPDGRIDDRQWDIVEIGIHESPPEHRRLFRRIHAKWDQLHTDVDVKQAKPVSAYGLRHPNSLPNAVTLAFTPLGQSVSDALMQIANPDAIDTSPVAFDRAIDRLHKKHPNNPWVHAVYIDQNMPRWWMSDWSANGQINASQRGWQALDADEGYTRLAPSFAKQALPIAERVIDQFRELYAGEHRFVAAYEAPMVERHGRAGGDAYYYPATLFHAAIMAMTLGKVSQAKKWLAEHYRRIEKDSFRAGPYLAILNLNLGRGPAARLYSPQHWGAWASLTKFMEFASKHDHARAREAVFHVLSVSPHMIRALDPSYRALDDVPTHDNRSHLPHLQEFLHWTRPFTQHHPEVLRALRSVAADPTVRREYETYHRAHHERFAAARTGGHRDHLAKQADSSLEWLKRAVNEVAARALPDVPLR